MVDPDVPVPRCVIVSGSQHLQVVNASDAFDQKGTTITVRWARYPARRLAIGAQTTFDRPFGGYLAPGVHDVHISLYGTSVAEVWLR